MMRYSSEYRRKVHMKNEICKKRFTDFQLKWIALVLMVMDHIHYFFEFTGKIPEWFSMLGRLSAPLFLFCLLEGFQHTRNRKKYFLRIYVIAVGMGLLQYIFICFVRRPDGFVPQNQMLATFSILLVILQGIDWCKQKKWGRGLSAIVLPLIWPFVGMGLIQAVPSAANAVLLLHYTLLPMHSAIIDGGTYFILEGILLYLFRKRRALQAAVFFVLALILEGVFPFLLTPVATAEMLITTMYGWMSGFAAIPMYLYNGQRGKGNKKLFYWFYPAHVYILYGISWVMQLL